MELYPLKCRPVYKEKIWGGNRIKKHFQRDIKKDNIGESWEVATHKNGISKVDNGPLAGKSLMKIVKKYPAELLGKLQQKIEDNQLPLLIKILDADQKLSVQVHPDNQYARRVEGESGKTEMWYIIKAEPGAKLVYGLKPGRTKNDISRSIKNGDLQKHLHEVTVKAGDVFFMPSGTIHAIEEGILLAEIQQNSDTTYRVYDWKRTDKDGKPRQLHVEKALDVINFKQKPTTARSTPLSYEGDGYQGSFLAACPYFVTEKLEVNNNFEIKPAGNKFYIIMNLTGSGHIIHQNTTYTLQPGTTYILPASLSKVNIKGNLNLLLTYLPENQEEVINKLKNLGFKNEEINDLAGINSWE